MLYSLPYRLNESRVNDSFRVEELTHGNKKKTDRIVWALQGRFEHGQITTIRRRMEH
jgi:hypothetical protein